MDSLTAQAAFFHPSEKETVITSSMDCTVRIWDLENIKKHKEIIKLRNAVCYFSRLFLTLIASKAQ
jgi:hypothetical protein